MPIRVCLNDLEDSESREVNIGKTWGYAYVRKLHDRRVIIVESRPAAQYLINNRFMSPDVIRHFFKNIMSIMYEACDKLKDRIFVPIFDGAQPLSEGLPSDVNQIIAKCKRRHTNGEWKASGTIEKDDITFSYVITRKGKNNIKIRISILDECAASGSSLIEALQLVVNYCTDRAKELLVNGVDKVTININIVGIWFSEIAIDRTRRFYNDFCTNWSNDVRYDSNIEFDPLGPFVLSMGVSALTGKSKIYGAETGLPLDHTDTLVSKKFLPLARKLCQGSEICAVGDVGLSIGNAKEKYPNGRPTHEFEWLYGHRAEAFVEAKFFEIDISKNPWAHEMRIIWNLKGNLVVPKFQLFMKESRPEIYEYYARVFGSGIEKLQVAVK